MQRLRQVLTTPVGAGLVLLALYLMLSFATDRGGYLGTDTGAKVATLAHMDSGHSFVPDVGYWAARWDPKGELHPLLFTDKIGDRFVNITTVPMVLAGEVLYRVGGYRASLLLPMVGAVLTAFAARALARRLGAGNGWAAFWLVGLATPVAVYALDFWEHAPGLAAMGWAVVLLVDVVDGRPGRRSWWPMAGAGALFGLAATMRTEALVVGFVFTAAALLTMLIRRRSPARTFGLGAVAAGAVVVALVLNDLLERLVLDGRDLRAGRATGAASAGFGELGTRLREGLLTTFGTVADAGWKPILTGAVVVLLAVFVLVAGRRPELRRLAVAAAVVAPLLVVLDFVQTGLGFVPGALIASPLALAGLLVARRDDTTRWLAGAALVTLPLVWLFEYSGGAGPQWGGRYVLLPSLVLTTLGVVALDGLDRPARFWLAGSALAITTVGLVWLGVRSADVDHAFTELEARQDPVLVSTSAFLLREGGGAYEGRRWLSVSSPAELQRALSMLDHLDTDRFALLAVGPVDHFPDLPGWRPGRRQTIALLPGEPMVVVEYTAS